jgi:hypothetical protein
MVIYGAVADDQQKVEITAYLSRTLPPVTAAPGDNALPPAQ